MLVKNWALLVKKTYGYQERDEERRREFKEKLERIDKRKIIYVDEAGSRQSRRLSLWL